MAVADKNINGQYFIVVLLRQFFPCGEALREAPTHEKPAASSGGVPLLFTSSVWDFWRLIEFVNTEGLWDGDYGLYSLSENT